MNCPSSGVVTVVAASSWRGGKRGGSNSSNHRRLRLRNALGRQRRRYAQPESEFVQPRSKGSDAVKNVLWLATGGELDGRK